MFSANINNENFDILKDTIDNNEKLLGLSPVQ